LIVAAVAQDIAPPIPQKLVVPERRSCHLDAHAARLRVG
jgi:hypothetical protein